MAKTINLAIQGGGAHGAFAWGMLDALLEDGRISVEGICATSAGTMNALAFADGLLRDGPQGARDKLEQLWRGVSNASTWASPVKAEPWQAFSNFGESLWNMDQSISFACFDSLSRMFSPYQWNIFDINPLRDLLLKQIDFEALRNQDQTKLFISATHVQSGRVKVFNASEVSIDVALASACLPFVFKAVTVDGEDYWDGGYMGNPSLYPLFYATDARDVMIMHINPLNRPETPKTGSDIMNRINEISFNASLIKDIRAIAFVKKLIAADMLKDEYKCQFKDVLVHSVRADSAMCDLSVTSKFRADWPFLCHLKDRGREAMQAWLSQHYAKLGKCDSVDIDGEYLHSLNSMFAPKQHCR